MKQLKLDFIPIVAVMTYETKEIKDDIRMQDYISKPVPKNIIIRILQELQII